MLSHKLAPTLDHSDVNQHDVRCCCTFAKLFSFTAELALEVQRCGCVFSPQKLVIYHKAGTGCTTLNQYCRSKATSQQSVVWLHRTQGLWLTHRPLSVLADTALPNQTVFHCLITLCRCTVWLKTPRIGVLSTGYPKDDLHKHFSTSRLIDLISPIVHLARSIDRQICHDQL